MKRRLEVSELIFKIISYTLLTVFALACLYPFIYAISAAISGEHEVEYNEIILLDNAIDSGFNCSAKYLVQLQGVASMKAINRGHQQLSTARLRSLRSFHDWCVANGLMK